MSKIYTIKTIDGNRYENIRDNKNYTRISTQLVMERKIITVEDMNGCIRHFNFNSIVYIKEEDDGEEED